MKSECEIHFTYIRGNLLFVDENTKPVRLPLLLLRKSIRTAETEATDHSGVI